MIQENREAHIPPFNGPIEIGLRSVAILNEAYPVSYSLQRLIILDYLAVHSDDLADGPPGLHPKTPHRGSEILVRRNVLQQGLLLYQSRGIIETKYQADGVYFSATEHSASFLDALGASYLIRLREIAAWLVHRFGNLSDKSLEEIVRPHIGEWGAEFTMESVLMTEEAT